jgi:DNA-binding transcriptional regulator GbsR (MarR family)
MGPGWLHGDMLSVSWWLIGDVLNGDVLQEPGWLHGDVLSDARSDLSMTSTLFVYYSHELCVHMIYVSVSVSPSGVFKKKICFQDVTNPSKFFFHDRVCPYHTHLSDLPHMATHHCAQAKSLVSTLLLLLLNPSVPARALQTPVGTGIMPMGAGLGNMPSPWAKPGPDTPIATGRTFFGGTLGQASAPVGSVFTAPVAFSPSTSSVEQTSVVTSSVSEPTFPPGVSVPSTPMDVSTSAVLKRTREVNPTNPVSKLFDHNSPDHEDEDDNEGEVLSEAETIHLQTQTWKSVRRYEELLTECDVLEAKVTRLLQKLENNPDDEDVQDVIVGSQSSLQTKRQAMRRLFSIVEDNCQRLQEVIDIYLPYDHVA